VIVITLSAAELQLVCQYDKSALIRRFFAERIG